ncbi:hypothetical protein ACTMTF_20620 [Nonomuraea sp. ZG12]|uniref:hypothetical protein n=1 Tax=Nonomuraea sp. ZG12 TaxID=3452207 RepID=UPI003F8B5D57
MLRSSPSTINPANLSPSRRGELKGGDSRGGDSRGGGSRGGDSRGGDSRGGMVAARCRLFRISGVEAAGAGPSLRARGFLGSFFITALLQQPSARGTGKDGPAHLVQQHIILVPARHLQRPAMAAAAQ